MRGGGVRGREGQCQTQDQRDPWSEWGQVRWRERCPWCRLIMGKAGSREGEAEGPEGLGCGPKRDEGGPVTWGR